jgi:5-methylcytosine-specific restriction endonuclease McrA
VRTPELDDESDPPACGDAEALQIPHPENEVAIRLYDVVSCLVRGDRSAASAQLAPLVGVTCMTHPIVKMPMRARGDWPVGSGKLTRSPPPSIMAMVYVRDSFTCRYCGRWTVPTQILRLISVAFPVEFPFHPHWQRGIAPRAYWDISTSVDHIHAVATGGDLRDPTNLATACARCQYQKSSLPLEALGWELRVAVEPGAWDGMMSLYPALWEATWRPDERHHSSWIRAFLGALRDDSASTSC